MPYVRRSAQILWRLAILPLLATPIASSSHARGADDVTELEEQAMIAAVEQIAPSVVQIETIGGLDRVDDVLVGDGPTTGLVVSADGYIISSAFNFVRQPASILVRLPAGRRVPAEVVARDHSRMLVLLKVETDEPLVVPEAVPLGEMVPGQWAIAVGRTITPDFPNMSVGILSATGRIWNKAVQTDAKISPNNYGGPLLDVRGRVFGVLVPMSPNSQSEMAGTEWYDSGIGFAVPLDDIFKHLETLKAGNDLHPGLMGVTLEGQNIYSLPAKIAAAQAKSPAREAGLQRGDTIVEIAGMPIATQGHLKHAMGARYAGETIKVVATRGDERLDFEIELTDKLIPYAHPFLGILPRRDDTEPGVLVRYVYPDSGAANAGVQLNDRVIRLAEQPITTAEELRLAIANLEPEQEVTFVVRRGDAEQQLTGTLATLPADPPDKLPPPRDRPELPDDAKGNIVDIKIPEEANDCFAYLPRGYDAANQYGVLIYLRRPGDFDRDALIGAWRDHCDNHDLILLAPQPRDPKRWKATEVEFIRKTLDHVVNNYSTDPTRIVAFGREAGAAMSFLLTFRYRELIRGIVSIDGAIPRTARPPFNDPVYRLAIYASYAARSPVAPQMEAASKALRDMKYPVTTNVTPKPGEPTDDTRATILRWVDSLDRI